MEHSKVVHLPTLSLLGFLLYLFMVFPSDYLGRVLAPSSLRLARLPPQVPPSPPQYPPYHPCSTYDVISFYCRRLGDLSPSPAVKVFGFLLVYRSKGFLYNN